jgi:hypothetical protein
MCRSVLLFLFQKAGLKTGFFFCGVMAVCFGGWAQGVHAIGGQGATCNPSTANWPNCELTEVPTRAHVTKTVHIPAGHYATPYVANQANTEYILQGDMTADSTAITVSASYVVVNLNGYTITYNQTEPGEGLNIGVYNLNTLPLLTVRSFRALPCRRVHPAV